MTRSSSLKTVKLPPPSEKSAAGHKGGKPYILAIAGQVKQNEQHLAETAAQKQFFVDLNPRVQWS